MEPTSDTDILGMGCTSCLILLAAMAAVVLVASLVVKVVFGL